MNGVRRAFFNWRNLLPLGIVCCFIIIAVAAPLLSPPADPSNPLPFKVFDSIEVSPTPPGPGLPLGTAVYFDTANNILVHYDVLHSLIWGTRDALRFGLSVALISACFGVLMGALSGYIGGAVNSLIMRLTDAFLAFPLIAGVWLFDQIMASLNWGGAFASLDAVVAPLNERQRLITSLGIDPVMLAFILFSWMPFARIINANVLRLKNTEYILAAQVLGIRPQRIIWRHLLPNAIAPAVIMMARDVGGLVILQAAFAFIGIGGSITEGLPEWSRLLLLGRTWIIGVEGNLWLFWWLYVPVTMALVLFGVGWNILGDRLNVLLNPWEGR